MTGIEWANGRRPHGLLDLVHPALRNAPRPDPAALDYDLDQALAAVLRLRAEIPAGAFTATILGTEREGSGVVIDEAGLVLTIGYLITEAETVTLTRADGETVAAEPVAYDHETGFGMVRAREPIDIAPLAIGRSETLAVGDPVVVAAFGGRGHALSGQVAAIREFAGSWEYLLDQAIYTVPMHPYWGGAALIDRAGRLVGTGSLYIEQGTEGGETVPGNMFVPIDLLAPIRAAMVRTGRADRPARAWLGMYAAEAEGRLIVTGVAPNGPADQGGIQPGDIVLSVEGEAVKTLPDYYRTLWSAGGPGAEIRYTLLREDDVITLRVKSGDRYGYLNLPRRH